MLGTKELLDLVRIGKPKAFFYISTISAAMIRDENGTMIEAWPGTTIPTKTDGYAMSKWAAECMVKKAKEANYHCSIFRLGNVTGDTKTGYSIIEENHIYLFLKGCLQLGYAPEMNTFVDMTPVDVLAKSICSLSKNTETKGQVLQLNNPHLIAWDNLLRSFIKHGDNIELLSLKEWQKKYLSKIDETNALYPLKALYMGDIDFTYQRYDTSKAQGILKKLGIHYPDDYTSLLELYEKFTKKVKFF